MSTLNITRGLPASGKTTWARDWVAADPAARARVNRDDTRAMLYGTTRGLTWEQERDVTTVTRGAVRELLKAGRDVVADDMNLRPRYVREWIRFARANGAELEIVEFPMSIEQCIERDAARDRPVGADTIRAIAERYAPGGHLQEIPDDTFDEPPANDGRVYTPRRGTPPAILVDIDGTLALMADRSPYDLGRVNEDLPNPAVVEAVKLARSAGHRIVLLSGREDAARPATEAWLRRHLYRGAVAVLPPYHALHMRPAGDRRRDSIVKAELFDAHVRDHYDIRWVFDDRQQVVDMWRDLGLTVFQVAPGDF